MSRLFSKSVILILAVAFLMTSIAVAQNDDAQPNIVIEEMRHDLGEQYEREVFSHKFQVKNTGQADLVIEQVKPG